MKIYFSLIILLQICVFSKAQKITNKNINHFVVEFDLGKTHAFEYVDNYIPLDSVMSISLLKKIMKREKPTDSQIAFCHDPAMNSTEYTHSFVVIDKKYRKAADDDELYDKHGYIYTIYANGVAEITHREKEKYYYISGIHSFISEKIKNKLEVHQ